MADPNEQLVRQLAQSLDAVDENAYREFLSEDAVHHIGGKSDLAGHHQGHGTQMTKVREAQKLSEGTHSARTQAVLSGDGYGAFLRRGTANKGGRSFEYDYIVLVRLQNGKIAESWNFYHDQHTWDALFSS